MTSHTQTANNSPNQVAMDPMNANIVAWTLSGQYDPSKPVLIDAADPNRSISKDQAMDLVASLIGAFEPDSTVCLHIANDILYPILFLAILANRCRWTGPNISYKAPELEHHLKLSKTDYIFVSDDRLETVRAAVHGSGNRAKIIRFTDILFPAPSERPECCSTHKRSNAAEFPSLHDLQRPKSRQALYDAIRDIDIHSIATLMSTSGTTGSLPKLAARTHQSTVLETAATEDNNAAKPYEIRRLFSTPIFHGFSAPEMMINSLRLGFPTYFMKRFDIVNWPLYIEKYGITESFAPPAILQMLVNSPDTHSKLQCLRNIHTGGAPFTSELKAKWDATFPNPPRVTQVWGMTEGGWYTSFKYPETDNTSSVGRALPGYEIRVSNDSRSTYNGIDVAELHVSSLNLMKHYIDNPAETQASFTPEGWLRTGDIGYIQDGKVYIIDRSKDLIKVNGFQVSPVEIENALQLLKNDVKDAGVFGVGTGNDEHPFAYIVPKHENVDRVAIKEFLKGRLSSYKVGSIEIAFIDEIPRNAGGKILRRVLRDRVRLE